VGAEGIVGSGQWAEGRIPSTKNKVGSTKLRNQNSKFKIPNSKT
jgi:hypothetical protein